MARRVVGAFQVRAVLLARLALRVAPARMAPKMPRVHAGRQERPAPEGQPAAPARKAQQAHRVRLDPKDHQDSQAAPAPAP